MHEVECIRVCEEILSQNFKNYKIRLNTSSILECIFEECDIEVQSRLDVLK